MAGRISRRESRPWLIAFLLGLTALAGAALQLFWMELPIYSFARGPILERWLGMTLLAETVVVLPWAALRGALLWRRLDADGHFAEYRRTRLSSRAIVVGFVAAAGRPVWLLLGWSLLLIIPAAVLTRGPSPLQVAAAHAVVASGVTAWVLLGAAPAQRLPASAAVPLAWGALALCLALVAAVDPFLRALPDPALAAYLALLPNPLTAVGSALGADVLRFTWLYERLHTHEYPFVYPPWWQTAALYTLVAAGLLSRQARLLHR